MSKQNNTAQVVPSIPLNPISAVEKDVQVVNAAPHASKSEQDDQESAHSARPMPVTPTGNDLTDVKAINGHEEDDEDKDSETDMIKGVYFEDEKGNVVMME